MTETGFEVNIFKAKKKNIK